MRLLLPTIQLGSTLTKLGIAALIVVAVIALIYRAVMSPQARDRRRRSRSYGRVVSRKRRSATVRLNAKAPIDKNGNKP
jgi:hypothetical protein